MELISQIMNLMANQDVIARFSLIILSALYGLFALILSIQIANLNKVVRQIGFAPIFNFLAYIHLAGALALLLFSVVSL
jgi:hypothetical protein